MNDGYVFHTIHKRVYSPYADAARHIYIEHAYLAVTTRLANMVSARVGHAAAQALTDTLRAASVPGDPNAAG